MSERREKIAKALHELDVQLRESDGDFGVKTAPWDEAGEYTRNTFRQYADAAIAAIDAEPTEAEVNAAVSAMTTHVWLHRPQEAMRAALLAARNARHE